MPYIKTRTNAVITKEKEIEIKKMLGEAITIFNKSEDWLMVDFDSESHLYFGGRDDELIAYIEVKIYGSSTRDAYNKMTVVLTDIISKELSISPSHIYISYSEYENWGWNGQNL